MKKALFALGLVAALALVLVSAGSAPAQAPDREVNQVKAFLTGKVQAYYRVGGVLFGTHHLFDLEYHPGGRYTYSVDTARRTILDNVQRGGWRDAGRWEVVRVGRQVGVRHQSDSGRVAFFPIQVLPGGEARLLPEGLPRNTEKSWLVKGWKYRVDVRTGKPPSIMLAPR
jgi:hypothetical protein